MKLVLPQAAYADLEQIAEWIARDNPRRAASFILELKERTLQLASQPESYPLVPRYEGSGIRRCVHGNYLIFYRITPDELQVLHVLHGAMDVEAILFPR